MTPAALVRPAAVDLGACIGNGVEEFLKRPLYHIVAFALVHGIGAVGCGLLWGPMMVGYHRVLVRQARGEEVPLGDLFRGFDDFVPAMLAGVVGWVATLLGFLCCIVPGFLLLPLPFVAVWFVATGEKDGIAAVQKAYEALKPNLLLGMVGFLLLHLLGTLGALACGVGLAATLPMAQIGVWTLARQLAPR